VNRNPAVKPTIGLANRPLVLHGRGNRRPTTVEAEMKRNTTELGTEGVVTPFKSNLLLLVMQLVIFHEDISNRSTSARADRPDKLPNLNNGVRCQLVQLNPKFL
jgi:hypothetical protein